ncbi:MAG: hypothetical protein IPN29_11960 [Saprospiraceae bacterium]|nr:hypothetical protein [Saprospiraceae bacterium]
MFNTQQIEELLEKYWMAETTNEEEGQLRAYFQSCEIDEAHQYAACYFTRIPKADGVVPDFTLNIMQKLVEKYFKAETTLEEEQLLATYFDQEQVAPDLMQYAPVFRSFGNLKKISYPHSLSLRKNKINQDAKVISHNWLRAVAAAIILVAVSVVLFKMNVPQEKPVIAKARYIEIEDPEEALAYTMQALAMVSRKYKKGEAQLLHGMQTMNDANVIRE